MTRTGYRFFATTIFYILGTLALALAFPITITAQDATPSPEGLTCTLPPRNASFIETIQGTPVAPEANREPLIEAYQASTQAPAAEDAAALQDALDQLIACFNAGDFA